MASDKQRREVAARLRNGGIARDSEEAYVLLLSCVGIRPQLPATSTYEDAMVRLADLIDCATCEDVSVPRGDRFTPYAEFKCSACGCSHVSLTYVRYCPNCGAEVRR